MKTTLLILSLFFLSFRTVTDEPADRMGIKGPLEFNKTSFSLSYADKPDTYYYIQEYLPQGEKKENFSQMLTIQLFAAEGMRTEEAVKQKVRELSAKKRADPGTKYQVNQSPDGKETLVDYLTNDNKDGKKIVEFGVCRYRQVEVGKKKKAIQMYGYSKRVSEDAIAAFMKELPIERPKYMNALSAAVLPQVMLEGQ